MTYSIPAPSDYHGDGDPYPSRIIHENSYLAREILDHRESNNDRLARFRVFQLALRWISIVNRGGIFVSYDTVYFSDHGRRSVELYYEQRYGIDIDIPQWAVLDGDENDVRVVGDESDFHSVVEDVMESTHAHDPDPTEEYAAPDLDGDLENYVGLMEGFVWDEISVGNPRVLRTLMFRLGVAHMAWEGTRMTEECAAALEILYKDWKLDVSVPEKVRYFGFEPPSDDVILTPGGFFDFVRERCPHFKSPKNR